MSKVLVRIEKEVPTTIFELPEIKLRVDTLFDNMKDDIKARFDEVKAFITKNEGDKRRYGKIAYDEITDLFKIYFYKSIINEAVELTFTENGKYDMVANILEILSDEKLKADILGEPMIYAFEKAIRNLPRDGFTVASIHGGTILLLEKEFLGRSIPI